MNFDNDTAILSVTRQERAGNQIRLLIPGEFTPDGLPIAESVPEVNAEQAGKWCNYVRATINARNESKSNKEGNRPGVPAGGGEGAAAASHQPGASGKDDDKPVPPSEEALVAGFQSRVQSLRRALENVDEELTRLNERKHTLVHDLGRTERAIRAINAALSEAELEEEDRFGGDE